jgi:hypothetical protein
MLIDANMLIDVASLNGQYWPPGPIKGRWHAFVMDMLGNKCHAQNGRLPPRPSSSGLSTSKTGVQDGPINGPKTKCIQKSQFWFCSSSQRFTA